MDWRVKALAGVVSAAITGCAAGALLGSVGSLIPLTTRAAGTTLAALAVVVLAAIRAPLVQVDHETPQSLLHRGPLIWSTANGSLLGLAVTSRIGFWLWYLVPVTVLASGSPLGGAVIWGVYAGVRLGTVAAIAMRMRGGDDRVHHVSRALLHAGKPLRQATTAVAIVAGVVVAAWYGT